jgi:sugar O-acyltransferase (sialic acid O-acetyltransferase NeuD family)
MSKKFYIIGTGGLSKEVYNLFVKYNWPNSFYFCGFFDENEDKCVKENGVYSLNNRVFDESEALIIAIGDPKTKQRLRDKFHPNTNFINLIHPNSVVSGTIIGAGSIIFPYVTCTANNTIGKCCTIYQNCSLSHDTVIGDCCNITPGVDIAGRCNIGNRVYLGIGCTISNDVSICDDVIIGAGAVVLKDIKEPGTYVGVPARKIK